MAVCLNYCRLVGHNSDFHFYLFIGCVVSNREIPEHGLENTAMKVLPAEKMTPERVYGKNGSMRKTKVPGTTTPYTVAALQVATNSFCQDTLLGEGSLGRVYKADFSNGEVKYAYCRIT